MKIGETKLKARRVIGASAALVALACGASAVLGYSLGQDEAESRLAALDSRLTWTHNKLVEAETRARELAAIEEGWRRVFGHGPDQKVVVPNTHVPAVTMSWSGHDYAVLLNGEQRELKTLSYYIEPKAGAKPADSQPAQMLAVSPFFHENEGVDLNLSFEPQIEVRPLSVGSVQLDNVYTLQLGQSSTSTTRALRFVRTNSEDGEAWIVPETVYEYDFTIVKNDNSGE